MDLEGSPPARRAVPPVEAERLADLLRQQLVAQKPDHALSKEAKWKTTRPTWSRDLGALLRTDGRSAARAAQLIRWVFGDQGGSEYRFVIESPKALRVKWDRVELAMSRPVRRVNGEPMAKGSDEDPILESPRRRHQ